jgi:hypothetical protein
MFLILCLCVSIAWVLEDSSAAAAGGCATPVFGSPIVYPQYVSFITSADFDGDGNLDLAASGPLLSMDSQHYAGMLSLYSGDGRGAIKYRDSAFGVGTDPRAIAAGDFDGDGMDDLVIASGNARAPFRDTSSYPNAVVVLNNGGIKPRREVRLKWPYPGSGIISTSAVVADFNADGNLDVTLTSADANAVLIALGDGAGNFTDLKTFISGGVFPAHSVAGDFNGDGKLDLAVANSSGNGNNVAILAGDGAGNFGAVTAHVVGAAPSFIASGNFNADDKLDLAVMVNGGAQNIAILIGNGAGGFAAPSYISSGGTTPGNLVAVDFNGDDKTDIGVVNKQESNVAILLGDGAGSFNLSTTVGTGRRFPNFIIAPDLSGDGKPELVVVHKGPGEREAFSLMINDCGATTSRLSFNPPSYSTYEGRPATLTVIRSGSLTGTVTVDYATSDGSAFSTSDYNATAGTLTFADGEASKTLTVEIIADRQEEAEETFFVRLSNPSASAVLWDGGFIEVKIDNGDPRPIFTIDDVSVMEGDGHAVVTVTRIYDLTGVTVLDYRTWDNDTYTRGCSDPRRDRGAAYARCDFATTYGRLHFAIGETQKKINIPIIDDGHDEGTETFGIFLWNRSVSYPEPIGNTITIEDNDEAGAANPIFGTPFFVRQHYLDFLAREPEAGEPWSEVLNRCPNVNDDPSCDRITVSQSFFRSQEFQLKGFYIFRLYKVAYNRMPAYGEFIADLSFIAAATEAEVYARKAQLARTFTQQSPLVTAHPPLLDSAFVSRLLGQYQLTQITTPDPAHPDGTAKVTLTQANLVNLLNTYALTRAQVLRALTDSDEVKAREFNNAFVAMQYYGYLQRTPDAAGYNAWLGVLQRGDIRTMVNGFMNSAEYKLRFGGL